VGKAFVYRATQHAGLVYENLLSRLLNRVFAGDSLALVASLFETRPPDKKQLKQLESLLGQLKKKHR
jgi:predicted transcriptional regulator